LRARKATQKNGKANKDHAPHDNLHLKGWRLIDAMNARGKALTASLFAEIRPASFSLQRG
jgi:hypothetical protein